MGILNDISTRAPKDWDESKIKDEIDDLQDRIKDLQRKFAANKSRALLIVLQGMDAAGKDSGVRGTFSGINPSGIEVYSFKKPSEKEFSHDYLWRVNAQLPSKGMIKIFNRSHYEDILVPSVYGYIDKEVIEQRYDQINNFETYLEQNGIKVLKFYLHVSKDEQLERLQDRVNVKRKHWKHNDGDWETRERWVDFMQVYEKIFERCNAVPWHIIGSDQNWYKVYQIAKAVEEYLSSLNMDWPELESERFKS